MLRWRAFQTDDQMNKHELLAYQVHLKEKKYNRVKHQLNQTGKKLHNGNAIVRRQSSLKINELKVELEKAEKALHGAKQQLLTYQLNNQLILF